MPAGPCIRRFAEANRYLLCQDCSPAAYCWPMKGSKKRGSPHLAPQSFSSTLHYACQDPSCGVLP